MDSVWSALGRWGKKVGEATKKAEDLAGNTWQHCKFFVFPVGFFLLSLLSRTTIEGEKLDSILKFSLFVTSVSFL